MKFSADTIANGTVTLELAKASLQLETLAALAKAQSKEQEELKRAKIKQAALSLGLPLGLGITGQVESVQVKGEKTRAKIALGYKIGEHDFTCEVWEDGAILRKANALQNFTSSNGFKAISVDDFAAFQKAELGE